MTFIQSAGLALLRRFDPETAHGLALKAVNAGLVPLPGPVKSPRLATTVCGLDLPNPVGLAAGFDKNAQAVDALARAGFGFLEVGAATPRAQPGNPKPRLFRLAEDKAAINRFGFNNDGMDQIASRLARRTRSIPVGLNLGANKDSTDKAKDFATVLRTTGHVVDFATVNVSSPNTEKLRDLQGADALRGLLRDIVEVREDLTLPIPIFLKIAPDLETEEIAQIAEVATDTKIDGLIATNTTLSRDQLTSDLRTEIGGLSGQPLFERSTRVLAQLSSQTDLPIIGVGGVASAEQAFQKIRAGASAVQLYTGMVYGGLALAESIPHGLNQLLSENGFDTVAGAVGTGRDDWL
ncbi:quinone-dependent dihydroorotate dehydrogenase [Litoreibacter roseus]|uniref:Dihydroorotate dehydrogenase (quinone) n=1 Tax=Litoreibacter roseus TaxID=2601869 RepID=A0A6N6JJ60_9RHOB|nr:quinone-dependent dihydroorotate dehydrogenase [Litoreibacter roseus]GFE65459.1 dihydroorotate dehydrogenase (quinone) [Litoreibacter roseus]